MIEIAVHPSPQTLSHPAVVTAHLINQSPGAELVSSVTLYFEPIGMSSIELIPTQAVDANYSNAIAQGIHNHLDTNITGLRIWWCDWLWHPIDSKPGVLTRAAAIATTEILPWLTLTNFVPEAVKRQPNPCSPFPNNIFEQAPVRLNSKSPLQHPAASRWTIKTPLISHIIRIQTAHSLSIKPTARNRLIGSQSVTQTTLSFKAIANTQRVCPVDKLPEFHREHGEIFNTFADTIHSQIPNARGFDVMVHQLTTELETQPVASRPSRRVATCLDILNGALQQAINVHGQKQ